MLGYQIKAIWVLDATSDGVSNFFENFKFFCEGRNAEGVQELFKYHSSTLRSAGALKNCLKTGVRAQSSPSKVATQYQDVLLLQPYQQVTLAADLVLLRGSADHLQTVLRIMILDSEADQYKQLYMSQDFCQYALKTLGLELVGEQAHQGVFVGDHKMLLLRSTKENALVIVIDGIDLYFSIQV